VEVACIQGEEMTRDQFITEVVLKKCWLEEENKFNPDLSTWEGFGKLWEFINKKMPHKERVRFLNSILRQRWDKHFCYVVPTRLIKPDRLACELARFYAWRGK